MLCMVVGLFWFPCELLSQETMKPTNVKIVNDQIVITYQVRSVDECLTVTSIEVVILATNEKIKPKSIKGELKEVKTGFHQILWDYKADNFFVDGQIDFNLFIKSCKKEIIGKNGNRKPIDPNLEPHPIGLKLGVGALGLASGGTAFIIRKNFDKQLTQLNELNTSLPQINGKLLSQSDKELWDNAYNRVQSSQKSGIFYGLTGIAILSAGYEAYLLLTKRKVDKKITILPTQTGFALRLRI